MQKGQWIYKITKTIRGIRGCICRRRRGYMGVHRRYKGVEGICSKSRGIYGSTKTIQGMGLDGICKTARE